jgi:hypothetical protein
MDGWEWTAGSVQGSSHRRLAINNQDAWTVHESPESLVAVIADGCGSGAHSEFGSALGARLIARLVSERCRLESPAEVSFWRAVERDALAELWQSWRVLGGAPRSTLAEYLLFTLVVAVVTPGHTVIAVCGDGLYIVNENACVMTSPGNAPPYLAYGLIDKALPHRFELRVVADTASVTNVLIGSDGAADLMAAAEKPLPGKVEVVGPVAQFWREDRYYANPEVTHRRLVLAGREVTRVRDGELDRSPGLLPDDTTLVTIRRKAARDE